VIGQSRFRSAVVGLAWRNLHNFFSQRALLVPSILFPLFFFTAFAGGLSALGKAPGFHYRGGYTAFQFAFVLIQSAAFGGVFTGFTLASDFDYGFARRIMLAVPNRLAIIVGYSLSALGRASFTIALLFGVALITGMSVSGGGIDIFGLILLALIVNIGSGLFAAGIAFRFRSIQAGPLMQTPVFLILFLAPVYVPLPLLTGWIHAVASVNPLTAVLDGARTLLAGTGSGIALAFVVAAALAVVLAQFAIRGLRQAEDAGSG
jgi:ABC-type multidrug transport system permease subunit